MYVYPSPLHGEPSQIIKIYALLNADGEIFHIQHFKGTVRQKLRGGHAKYNWKALLKGLNFFLRDTLQFKKQVLPNPDLST